MKRFLKLNVLIGFLLSATLSFGQQSPPDFRWAKGIGLSTSDLVVDSFGYTYSLSVMSQIFIPHSPYFHTILHSNGGYDMLITKQDPLGNILWVKQLRTDPRFSFNNIGLNNNIVMDKHGNIFIHGGFQGWIDFDPGPVWDSLHANAGQRYTSFIAKYSHDGNLIWAKAFRNISFNASFGINSLVLDNDNNLYLLGSFQGTMCFEPGTNNHAHTSAQNGSAATPFLLKLNNNGGFQWLNTFGNVASGIGRYVSCLAISKDPEAGSQSVVVGANFSNTADFDPDPNATFYLSPDSGHYFIAKYGTDGHLIWAGNVGDTAVNHNVFSDVHLVIDNQNHIYWAGSFTGQPNISPNHQAYTTISEAHNVGFVAKLAPSGKAIWVKGIQKGTFSHPYCSLLDITTDKYGAIYGVGEGNADFNPGPGLNEVDSASFIFKWDSSGNFQFLTYSDNTSSYPSYSYVGSNSIKVDQYLNIFTAGGFTNTSDLDPGPDSAFLTAQNISGFFRAGFTRKFSQNCPLVIDSATVIACHSYDFHGLVLDSSGRYTVDLPRANSTCDSIVILDLTIAPAISTVTAHGDTLISDDTTAIAYRWLRCDSSGHKTPIPGATHRKYRPTTNGKYAVVVFKANCTDTSVCVQIQVNNAGINNLSMAQNFNIIPNPTQNQVQIRFGEAIHHVGLKLTTALGKVIWEKNDFSGKSTKIDLSGLATGVYYLTVQNDSGITVKKVVKY